MKIAAFFDIDGTIIRCQTQEELIHFFLKRKEISLYKVSALLFWFVIYKIGLVRGSTESLRRRSYTLLCNQPAVEIDAYIREAYEELIRPQLNQKVCERIKWHRLNGHVLIAVSGTLMPFCTLVCQDVGIDEYYGTQLKIDKGYYRPSWIGNILEGDEKARFIQDLAQRKLIDLSLSYAYADKVSDMPFLEAVKNPVAVNPDIRLKNFALARKWEILNSES